MIQEEFDGTFSLVQELSEHFMHIERRRKGGQTVNLISKHH